MAAEKARQQHNSPVTASADASTIPALKARQEYSPGQRPGNKPSPEIPSPEGAQHIHRNPCVDTYLCVSLVSPLQGCALIDPQNPGRCPGLYYRCPFRAWRTPRKGSVAHSERSHVLEGPLRGNVTRKADECRLRCSTVTQKPDCAYPLVVTQHSIW